MKEKQKIEGVDNKELILFVIVIVIVVLLLIFEMFFFEGRPEVAEEQAWVKAELEAMKSETISAEQRTVYHALNDIVEMMNNKDYKGLYNNLKEDYKNYYFSEYDSFEEFMKTYASEKYYPKYTSYYRKGDFYYIIVDFLKEKYTREDLLKLKVKKVDTIVLEEVGKGKFNFAMNGFVENINHNRSKTVNDVTFTLQSSVRNTETMEISVVVFNKSNKALSIATENIIPEITGSSTALVSVTEAFEIQPGEARVLTEEFYMQYNSGREFQGVTITGVEFDDGVVIEDVYLAK